MATTWRRNPAGIDALVTSPPARAALKRRAGTIARTANRMSPTEAARVIERSDGGDAKTDPQTPAYVSTRTKRTANGIDAKVYGGPGQHIIEFGSVNNPPYAPLRRALRSLGLEVKP